MHSESNFESLGLSAEILQAIKEKGYTSPSPIQAKAIPIVLEGKDLMAAAQTGTGKTAGFTLPILQKLLQGQQVQANQARVLILTPTRELAAQVEDSVQTYGKHTKLRSTVVFGGVKINPQMQKLRKGVDILVATPGRLLDLYNQNAVKFKQLEILVLDEADRMLDMGFIHDIRKILAVLPKQRQNLLFSATFSEEIRTLAKGILHQPVEISVTPRNAAAKTVEQWICPVDKKQKPALLSHLIKENSWKQVLVFSRTKHGANKVAKFLDGEGIKAAAIHGNKSQSARTKALAEFKNGDVQALVATDIAARGIDIDQLPHVINLDLPNVAEDYVHRIGRTGRAGSTGQAVSLVSADEFEQLADIEYLIKNLLPRKLIDGFEPVHDLPPSSLSKNPKKQKKPKKPKAGHKDGQRSGENSQGHKAASQSPAEANTQSSKKKKYRNRKKPSNVSNTNSGNKKSATAGGGAAKKRFKPKAKTPK